MVLMKHAIIEKKILFNKRFSSMIQQKLGDMSKIENIQSRIQDINSELEIQETLMKPSLDDAEVPDRILLVSDYEIKSKKVIDILANH